MSEEASKPHRHADGRPCVHHTTVMRHVVTHANMSRVNPYLLAYLLHLCGCALAAPAASSVKPGAENGHERDDVAGELLFKRNVLPLFENAAGLTHSRI